MTNTKINHKKGNAFIGLIIIVAIIWGISSLFSPDDNEFEELEPEYYNGYECTDDCSGHEAGYNWAEENGISSEYDCGGNSNSFIEGCQSYVEDNY